MVKRQPTIDDVVTYNIDNTIHSLSSNEDPNRLFHIEPERCSSLIEESFPDVELIGNERVPPGVQTLAGLELFVPDNVRIGGGGVNYHLPAVLRDNELKLCYLLEQLENENGLIKFNIDMANAIPLDRRDETVKKRGLRDLFTDQIITGEIIGFDREAEPINLIPLFNKAYNITNLLPTDKEGYVRLEPNGILNIGREKIHISDIDIDVFRDIYEKSDNNNYIVLDNSWGEEIGNGIYLRNKKVKGRGVYAHNFGRIDESNLKAFCSSIISREKDKKPEEITEDVDNLLNQLIEKYDGNIPPMLASSIFVPAYGAIANESEAEFLKAAKEKLEIEDENDLYVDSVFGKQYFISDQRNPLALGSEATIFVNFQYGKIRESVTKEGVYIHTLRLSAGIFDKKGNPSVCGSSLVYRRASPKKNSA